MRFRDCFFNTPDMQFDVSDWIDAPTQSGCFYSIERCDYGFHHGAGAELNRPIPDAKTAW